VAPAAAAALAARFPGLKVAGTHTPPAGFGDDGAGTEAAVQAVSAARPDILFVGVGSPRQEYWVHQHWDRLSAVVAVCCGAALDYAAGTMRRAPAWMRGTGLEWLWRLAREPRRLWRRYLVRDAAFVGIVLKEWWRRRVRVSR
jgi:N-acetylglucosaminyldiphosphoundecaprenol N-acetyl-beta-D-mannosaminyltransferase